MTDHREAAYTEMIGQLLDVVRPALIAPVWVIRAMTIPRAIGHDELCSIAGRDIGQTREMVARTRRAMERKHRRTITNSIRDPCQFTPISELTHSGSYSGISHDAYRLDRPDRGATVPAGSFVFR
jgi:hypothetical protein